MNTRSPIEKIALVRKYRGYSQSKMAKLLGITQASWGRKEKGSINSFSLESVTLILKCLNVDARWVFGQRVCTLEEALLDDFMDNIIEISPVSSYQEKEDIKIKTIKPKNIPLDTIEDQLGRFESLIEGNKHQRDHIFKEIALFKQMVEDQYYVDKDKIYEKD